MEKEIRSIGVATKSSAMIIGESMKSIKNNTEEYLINQIKFFETALKYTNKTVLKNRHKKELLYLNTSLNYLTFNVKTSNYLESLSEFARSGVR